MNVLDSPDEMCASILKYCNFGTILQCRRLSSRLNRIATRFDLNRVPVGSISLGVVLSEKSLLAARTMNEERNINMKADRRRNHAVSESGYTLEPIDSELDHSILQVEIYLRTDIDPSMAHYHHKQWLCVRLTENLNKYEAMDSVLKKVRGVHNISVDGDDKYNREFDECLCRNNKALRKIEKFHFDATIITKEPNNYRFMSNFPNLYYISLSDSNIDDDLETFFEKYSGGLGLLGRFQPRRPQNIGDNFLHKWMRKLPKASMLTNYRNNFTLPAFTQFLLKLVNSGLTNWDYQFGILANANNEVEEMKRILKKNNIPFNFVSSYRFTWNFTIHLRETRLLIFFQFDKVENQG